MLNINTDPQSYWAAKEAESRRAMQTQPINPAGGLMAAPMPINDFGGLFNFSPINSPMGGLMDFNALALQLAGEPGPQAVPQGVPAIPANSVQQTPSIFPFNRDSVNQFLFPSRFDGYRGFNRANIGVRG